IHDPTALPSEFLISQSFRPNKCMITTREREIIHWCDAGKTAIEIATILGRSHRTSQNVILNIQRKLNVVNTPQMIAE
ncbi:helix-turn-helix domain-containing protein, partial [Rhizobium ruizarguesonis]